MGKSIQSLSNDRNTFKELDLNRPKNDNHKCLKESKCNRSDVTKCKIVDKTNNKSLSNQSSTVSNNPSVSCYYYLI